MKKAFRLMFFNYAAMMGVPVLMLVLAVLPLLGLPGVVRTVVVGLIALGCLVYGVIGFREAFLHGGSRHATPRR